VGIDKRVKVGRKEVEEEEMGVEKGVKGRRWIIRVKMEMGWDGRSEVRGDGDRW
jgi:hypothetical protein